MSEMFKPELLSPAGDEEKLKSAVKFGADAVYLASDMFGMRTAAASFGGESLKTACEYAHDNNVKVYLTCNTVPRNDEVKFLPEFLEKVQDYGVDALITTDLGVLRLAKKYAPKVDIHISTQAGITNYECAGAFYELGAKRIVTARELSMSEIVELRAKTPKDLEIECFVHGAMCVSFSGRCLLSNYLVGRDSNRGDCAQPCRWNYYLMEEKRDGLFFPIEQDKTGTYIMNSRDMCMIEHIPELVAAGVNSFKIEGRAKSAYYTAVVTNAYRAAIDGFVTSGYDPEYKVDDWIRKETERVSNREYCTGFYYSSPLEDAQIFYTGGYVRSWDVVGVVEKCSNGRLYAEQRNKFHNGDTIEIMMKGREPVVIRVEDLQNSKGELIESAPHATMKLSFKCDYDIPEGSYMRSERPE